MKSISTTTSLRWTKYTSRPLKEVQLSRSTYVFYEDNIVKLIKEELGSLENKDNLKWTVSIDESRLVPRSGMCRALTLPKIKFFRNQLHQGNSTLIEAVQKKKNNARSRSRS